MMHEQTWVKYFRPLDEHGRKQYHITKCGLQARPKRNILRCKLEGDRYKRQQVLLNSHVH